MLARPLPPLTLRIMQALPGLTALTLIALLFSGYVLFPTPNNLAPIDWATIGPQYRDHMVENGKISVTCEFCSSTYLFDPAEVVPDPAETESTDSGKHDA